MQQPSPMVFTHGFCPECGAKCAGDFKRLTRSVSCSDCGWSGSAGALNANYTLSELASMMTVREGGLWLRMLMDANWRVQRAVFIAVLLAVVAIIAIASRGGH